MFYPLLATMPVRCDGTKHCSHAIHPPCDTIIHRTVTLSSPCFPGHAVIPSCLHHPYLYQHGPHLSILAADCPSLIVVYTASPSLATPPVLTRPRLPNLSCFIVRLCVLFFIVFLFLDFGDEECFDFLGFILLIIHFRFQCTFLHYVRVRCLHVPFVLILSLIFHFLNLVTKLKGQSPSSRPN